MYNFIKRKYIDRTLTNKQLQNYVGVFITQAQADEIMASKTQSN